MSDTIFGVSTVASTLLWPVTLTVLPTWHATFVLYSPWDHIPSNIPLSSTVSFWPSRDLLTTWPPDQLTTVYDNLIYNCIVITCLRVPQLIYSPNLHTIRFIFRSYKAKWTDRQNAVDNVVLVTIPRISSCMYSTYTSEYRHVKIIAKALSYTFWERKRKREQKRHGELVRERERERAIETRDIVWID